MQTLRRRLKLSQEGLADRLGVSRASVNRWENGRSHPSEELLGAIKHLWAAMPPEPKPEASSERPDRLRQSDVMRILGVSHQRVRSLRIRRTLPFEWDEDLETWVTSEKEVDRYLRRKGKRLKRMDLRESSLTPKGDQNFKNADRRGEN
ncbi:helix-turn-helix domain-containing protein [Lyngbya sp. CCY1209]|uniref:helix-turn-helix transcriptional regulator n=1 Tax=Lyngbya sp. CCY1209 TaxID=2886103 RepID=UPI002D2023FA|nr:helix-turn-helix domain-containing protein [Lyngbya sp. CCY1209]MEB3884203.1 helix-turn-helix domain-containing protein [Lyngbya sp. CCY1209]